MPALDLSDQVADCWPPASELDADCLTYQTRSAITSDEIFCPQGLAIGQLDIDAAIVLREIRYLTGDRSAPIARQPSRHARKLRLLWPGCDQEPALVGNNGSGKTALLTALMRCLGVTEAQRAVHRRDFHLSADQHEVASGATLSIDIVLAFPERRIPAVQAPSLYTAQRT